MPGGIHKYINGKLYSAIYTRHITDKIDAEKLEDELKIEYPNRNIKIEKRGKDVRGNDIWWVWLENTKEDKELLEKRNFYRT